MLVFGPVPSRRLGFSLGINHIPPKNCTYSCVYCQVGRTTNLSITRKKYFPLNRIMSEVQENLIKCRKLDRQIDYITLVPDGEPTLEKNLGDLIVELKQFQIPVAVISNASLIDQVDVQKGLHKADWVSLKVDSVSDYTWRKINRPNHKLSLPLILNGILEFRKVFQGEIVTETMLVEGVNDSDEEINALTDYLLDLRPNKSYLSIPTRPPAESWVTPPDANSLARILKIFEGKISFGALLFDTEGTDFVSTGDIEQDILSITSVHPLREQAMQKIIQEAGENWSILEILMEQKKIQCIHYRGENFYCRKH